MLCMLCSYCPFQNLLSIFDLPVTEDKKNYLEIKYSSVEGRFKTNKLINDKYPLAKDENNKIINVETNIENGNIQDEAQNHSVPLVGKKCPKGYRINKTTGMCEFYNPTIKKSKTKKVKKEKQEKTESQKIKKRCPNGTRKNKITGNCEPK